MGKGPDRIAPGARVVIRDAQWLVRRAEPSAAGGKILHCTGLSEIVRDKDAMFLTRAETRIKVMDPAKTELVQDKSPNFQESRLYVESLLRRSVPTDDRLYCGHRAAMDSVPYQLEPAAMALSKPRQRFLIADAVGLGKTMECGILLSELIRRGRGRRILVVTVKSMMTQFQKEMWARFSIPLTRLDSVGLRRVREMIPANHNPFRYYDKSIVSVDTLKRDAEYRTHLESARWDVIVIDEAHNVARRRNGKRSDRSRLADLLATRSDTLILMSATPHDGSATSFASLMHMLDPTAIADPEHYAKGDIADLYVRRFKKDVRDQAGSAFREREIRVLRAQASPREEAVFSLLSGADLGRFDKGGDRLYKTVLEKSVFSSPAACLETVDRTLRHPGDAGEAALAALAGLRDALAGIGPGDFSKFGRLVRELRDGRSPFRFTGREADDRLIVFTERIATLRFLERHLPPALGLGPDQVAVLLGTDSDVVQQAVVERFGRRDDRVRLLIATDVASEGINLHYLCSKMIHFDVPWSLMTFQQRNGRIDRYGQERVPCIAYMTTGTVDPDIGGDMRILELLVEKDRQATENIGDPSAFLGLYDPEDEERRIAEAMETGSAEALEAEMDARAGGEGDGDLFDIDALLRLDDAPRAAPRTASMPTLFADDFSFAAAAVRRLGLRGAELDEAGRSMILRWGGSEPWCGDLRNRFRRFPAEIRRMPDIRLSADKALVQRSIADSRREGDDWPAVQYLWEMHPVLGWLADKVASSYRRLQAPVLAVPGLAPGEALFLVSGVIPNRSGQAVVDEWLVIDASGRHVPVGRALDLMSDDGRPLPNRGAPVDVKRLEAMLPDVVARAAVLMREEGERTQARLRPLLDGQTERLRELHDRHVAHLRGRYDALQETNRLAAERLAKLIRQKDEVFREHEAWARDAFRTEDHPCIRIAAVLTAEEEE